MKTALSWTAQALFLTFLVSCTPTSESSLSQAQSATGTSNPAAIRSRVVASGLGPLSEVPIAQPIGGDILDNRAAIRLGKALFWDVQASSDGQVACATCHFHGGTDNRRLNTVDPGIDGIIASGGVTGPGQLFDGSSITNDDRVGSQGVVGGRLVGLDPDPSHGADLCTPDYTAPFFEHRRVTRRKTPALIGAVFNRLNFWNGRARPIFNGLDTFGDTLNGNGTRRIGNSALASQAVDPPLNTKEMSCAGRTFNGPGSLGAKMLARRPLQFQQVSADDSVLGKLSAWPQTGLTASYQALIDAAFAPEVAGDAVNQFSSIWGQAIQAYESTLVADRTPLDRFLKGHKGHPRALTTEQLRGLELFVGKAGCVQCHAGPELTDATYGFAALHGLINSDGGDQGFHNIGVRPTGDDMGHAEIGARGVSFSDSRSVADRGAFKTPPLRNVKLRAPYFHNGGKATLAEVVDLYDRGGDFANPEKSSLIVPLGLTDEEKAALVEFLTNALTDRRVENHQAPFDHPSLTVPNGPDLPAVGEDGLGGSEGDSED